MAIKERKVVLVSKDEKGNTCMDMPLTTIDQVEGGVASVNGAIPDGSGKVSISIPEQVNPDWNATSGKGQILNKPYIPSKAEQIAEIGVGFIRYSSGLQICYDDWHEYWDKNDVGKVVYYPRPFVTAPAISFAEQTLTPEVGFAASKTNTKFELQTNNTAYRNYISWIAIGMWK